MKMRFEFGSMTLLMGEYKFEVARKLCKPAA